MVRIQYSIVIYCCVLVCDLLRTQLALCCIIELGVGDQVFLVPELCYKISQHDFLERQGKDAGSDWHDIMGTSLSRATADVQLWQKSFATFSMKKVYGNS